MTVFAAVLSISDLGAVFSGDGIDPGLPVFFVSLTVLILLPYLALWAVSRLWRPARLPDGLVILGIAAVTGWYFHFFWTVFWFNPAPDAQDGIGMLFVPFPALGIAGIAALAAGLVARAGRDRR